MVTAWRRHCQCGTLHIQLKLWFEIDKTDVPTDPGCSRTMPAETHDWNSFQRAHKGKWSKDELRRQWSMHKQQHGAEPVAAVSDTSTSKAQHLAALKAGLLALTQPTPASTWAEEGGSKPGAVNVAEAAASRIRANAGQPAEVVGDKRGCSDQSTTHHSSPATRVTAQQQDPQSDAAATCFSVQQQLGDVQRSPAGDSEEFLSISTAVSAADADASPSSTAGSQTRLSEVQAHELAKLREAVQHLLSKQQQQHLQQQQPQQPQQARPQQTCVGPCGSPAVSSGCFPRAHSKLSWNAFQRACKGRGLSKTEISAAYQQAKQHYQHTGQLLDLNGPQQQQGPAMPWCAPPAQQQQQQQRPSKWGTLQHWIHSRASSRAASRACSAAASPNSSPARMLQQGQHPQAQQSQQGKWGAFKEWLHSRGSSRAASRLCSPAASPGMKCPEAQQAKQQTQQQGLQAQPVQQLHPERHANAAQQQQQVLVGDACVQLDDADAACLPFAHQQLYQHPANTHQQLQQTGLSQHAGSSGRSSSGSLQVQVLLDNSGTPAAATNMHQQQQLPHSQLCPSGSSCSTPSRPLEVVAAASGSSCCSTVSVVATSSTAGASSAGVGTAAAAAGVTRIGRRLVREAVPHDLPGLLEGFSDWVRVGMEPRQLRRLKRAVPAQPGLYEWGVQLPVSSADDQQGTRKPQYGPVLSFYLGKAGTLVPQRPRRSSGHYGATTGETLRTRLNKYCLTKAGRVGPVSEPHKAAFFEQLLRAGGRLHYRWRVCTDVEPSEAETQLLQLLDYSLNYMHNNRRRALMVFAA